MNVLHHVLAHLEKEKMLVTSDPFGNILLYEGSLPKGRRVVFYKMPRSSTPYAVHVIGKRPLYFEKAEEGAGMVFRVMKEETVNVSSDAIEREILQCLVDGIGKRFKDVTGDGEYYYEDRREVVFCSYEGKKGRLVVGMSLREDRTPLYTIALLGTDSVGKGRVESKSQQSLEDIVSIYDEWLTELSDRVS
ncbi:hypothetical protein IMZ31_22550 (plasmid) [Pontibacillus sp. ALD_SL1]|uniref:hypothetical protein n=1 Tax=Pontibacillus sp. ALD_SL1 TaxID=2777185 RepID=UPI001A96A8A0|nr:hypothetical protein [Pontibacillus sp. ALD_SL1]QST02237.1 hypothetical protein IMZ31_22550 [Pontibacillus sp. ALD_SL1]